MVTTKLSNIRMILYLSATLSIPTSFSSIQIFKCCIISFFS